MKKVKHKLNKRILLLFILLVVLFFIGTIPIYASAESNNENQVYENLNQTIFEQLQNLDFSGLDNFIKTLTFDTDSLFPTGSFKDKVLSIISGEFRENYSSILNALLGLIFESLLSFIPLFSLVIGIGILSSIMSNLTMNSKNKTIADIVHFVCYSLIIIIVFTAVVNLSNVTAKTLSSMKMQIDLVFPILLTIMTALGSTVAASVYQPAVAIFSSTIVQLFSSIIMPLFIFTLVFNVVGNLSNDIQLKKFHEFFNSTFKWLVGTVFTIFTAFLSIQGITAGSFDKVSIRTAKFAIKSYVPIIGGYLSDGFNVIMASGVLIKNAVGFVGVILMFFTILVPVIDLVILKLGLNLTAAILEPITDKRISNFIMSVSKTLVMLLATILAVAFMYFIMIGLIISTANLI